MSNSRTSTTPAVPTEAVAALLAKRQERIEAALAEMAKGEVARGKGDKAGSLSSGGRLANRTREIRETELDLAEEGHEVEPWQLPRTKTSKMQPMSQEQIETALAKVGQVYQTTKFESVKHSADVRIQALLKAAEKRGYQVQDPRK
jgi:hypothetical protein